MGFCTAALLGHLDSNQGSPEGQALLWATKGSPWLQQQAALPDSSAAQHPDPETPLHQHQQQANGWSAFAAMDNPSEAPFGHQSSNVNKGTADESSAQVGFAAALEQAVVPALQLPGQGSPQPGNPFASPAQSFDAAGQPGGKAPDTVQQQGRAVPPLALHKIPMRFGPPELQRSLSPKSRFARSKSEALGMSFTSASLSYSDTTSMGYTTRAASPDPGLRQSLLRAVQSPPPPEEEDPTLAVSNPLFGCTPQRGNSPGKNIQSSIRGA